MWYTWIYHRGLSLCMLVHAVHTIRGLCMLYTAVHCTSRREFCPRSTPTKMHRFCGKWFRQSPKANVWNLHLATASSRHPQGECTRARGSMYNPWKLPLQLKLFVLTTWTCICTASQKLLWMAGHMPACTQGALDETFDFASPLGGDSRVFVNLIAGRVMERSVNIGHWKLCISCPRVL